MVHLSLIFFVSLSLFSYKIIQVFKHQAIGERFQGFVSDDKAFINWYMKSTPS
jgi:hypothetical protein